MTTCDDLVLSVLKSPLRDQSMMSNLSNLSMGGESLNSDLSAGLSGNRLSNATTMTATTAQSPGYA